MPWPPRQPPREEIDPGELDAYETVVERRRRFAPDVDPERDGGYYGRLLLSPPLAAGLSELGRFVRERGEHGDTYTHAERELVDQVLSVDLGTNVVQRLHVPDAITAGVRPEAIAALRAGREEDLTDDERRLVRFIRAVVAGTVDEELWTDMEARMGERGVLEYAVFVLYLQLTMRLQQAVGMPEAPDAEIDALLADLAAGARPLPDFRARLR